MHHQGNFAINGEQNAIKRPITLTALVPWFDQFHRHGQQESDAAYTATSVSRYQPFHRHTLDPRRKEDPFRIVNYFRPSFTRYSISIYKHRFRFSNYLTILTLDPVSFLHSLFFSMLERNAKKGWRNCGYNFNF